MSVHTAGRQLRLYRVGIDWQQSMGKDQIASLPRLSFQHLETVEECSPMSDHAGLQSDMFMIAPSEAQLTQLELLAQHSDFRNKQTALPTLLATFSYSPSHFTTNVSREPSFSVLCRWELRNGKSTLHTAFASLGSKKAMSPVGLKVGDPSHNDTPSYFSDADDQNRRRRLSSGWTTLCLVILLSMCSRSALEPS